MTSKGKQFTVRTLDPRSELNDTRCVIFVWNRTISNKMFDFYGAQAQMMQLQSELHNLPHDDKPNSFRDVSQFY